MYTTGFMLLLVATPLGIGIALESRFKLHERLRDAVLDGEGITLSFALVGYVLFLGPELLTKLQRPN
jgi:hypothetical protein